MLNLIILLRLVIIFPLISDKMVVFNKIVDNLNVVHALISSNWRCINSPYVISSSIGSNRQQSSHKPVKAFDSDADVVYLIRTGSMVRHVSPIIQAIPIIYCMLIMTNSTWI